MATRNTVPRTTEVIPGAHVSIVLKADQRTGREVQGTVRDVLTRGDHHRGIKVRLTDGRIGRVQRMTPGNSDSSASPPDATAAGSSVSPSCEITTLTGGPLPGRRGQHPRYRDVRLDEPLDVPPERVDLGAYIVPNRRKGKASKGSSSDQPGNSTDGSNAARSNNSGAVAEVASATATCPVCNAFEGDEAAVAHHVAEHFE
ncbi:hypothetical protein DL764_001176 [Monosporascus ibericus]|uniref:UBZ4-type domain-containing protein n=1 Tax=Monosporascus ibericus TaxID=155417 RepID=A0A4Q4TT36_9PEZI|nr:hypothetical protein DL764_001176 [Monosporascus ibericus]